MFDFDEYSSDILAWLKKLQGSENLGRFRFCMKGSKVFPSDDRGLGASCLALKIVFTINAIDQFTSGQMEQWADHIKSFQIGCPDKYPGFFEDRGLTNAVDGLKVRRFYLRGPFKFIKNVAVRRAETRQACAALRCVDKSTNYPVKAIPQNTEEAMEYFNSLNWKSPWGAGSHFSHLIFFLKYNADNFGMHSDYENIMPMLWTEIDKMLDKNTGCWFLGDCTDFQKINGAMKILTAHALVNRPPTYPDKLIDFCLSVSQANDGCHLLDILYATHYCAKYTDHRRNEIKQFAEQQMKNIMKFRKSDGAFSYFQNKSQTNYYGQKISRGLCESDIHGTHLFTWALTLIAELLADFKEIPWKTPVT